MGKKTNWTVTEDQTLCRAWLCASETAIAQSGDQKASSFWGMVHHMFHAELESSVERPVNGLKIRWSRINRDVQKFALLFTRVHSALSPSPMAEATTELEAAREKRCIEDALELFFKEQGAKFAFESCWKLLRFSPKWLQLLANSSGVSVSSFGASAATASSAAALPADLALRDDSLPHVALDHRPSLLKAQSLEQWQAASAPLTAALKRQNELMEEQNAIALFQMDVSSVQDHVARAYFSDLRQRYLKKMRRTVETEEPPSAQSVEAENEVETTEEHAVVKFNELERSL